MSNYAVLVVQSPGVSVCVCACLCEKTLIVEAVLVVEQLSDRERIGTKTNLNDALWPLH